tara:strand:+ start:53 stop:781 length:729 start_codon:yes stop_codon:yes gene_type:complete
MRESSQDKYYLEKEGDDFFKRNFANKDLSELRHSKKIIFEEIQESGISYQKVLEYGCNFGDLLFHFKQQQQVQECIGVEASNQAMTFGKQKFGNSINLVNGTIANNQINDDAKFENYFDLIIIDDVFGWVSRETLFQSISNIDNVLKDGGFLFIRDFYPDRRTKNRNHHVEDELVFNFKIPGSHASIFLTSGMYEIQWQKIFFDKIELSTSYKSDNPFHYRWVDTILKKSNSEYFEERKQIK